MGKKTNWTTAEDQTLCRVWLSASDLQLHSVEQKASNFWNVVMEMFHQEMASPVERPLNGLKVRWTRINRDSQKFASIFNELQNKRMKQAEGSGGDSDNAAAVALLTEQSWIDDAKAIFHRIYNAKFSFEACWKQLRYSAKWIQLFANSNSYPVMAINSLPATPIIATEETPRAEALSDACSEQGTSMIEHPTTTPSDLSMKNPSSLSNGTAPSPVEAVSAATQSSDANAFIIPPSNKRQADMSPESLDQIPHSTRSIGLTSTLVEELKRQNDLMEDQNAIALLKINGETISDADTRQCYQLLRARYLKKARNGSSGRTSTIV